MSATQQALLERLADGALHSGQRLADDLGVSRAAVGKQVARLRARGWPIHARRGGGYQLPSLERPLARAPLEAALAPLGAAIASLELLDEVDSTNRHLDRAPTPPPGTVRLCIAESQHAGRGRRERPWASRPGGAITFSASRSFDRAPAELGPLGLAVGVGIAETLRDYGLDRVGLKWPNDVMHGGAKLGGILVEVQGEAAGRTRVIAGVGVNHQPPADPVASGGAGVVEVAPGEVPDRAELAGALMRSTADVLAVFAEDGFAAFADRFDRLDVLRGREVRVWTPLATVDGVARGIAPDGALVFEDESGDHRRLHSAEVSIRARE